MDPASPGPASLDWASLDWASTVRSRHSLGCGSQGSRLAAGGAYALLGTSAWVDVEPADVELGVADALMASYPAAAKEIGAFTR